MALLSWNRLLYWFSFERLHKISFPAREKRDCKGYAAVPSENLHQVRFYWIFIRIITSFQMSKCSQDPTHIYLVLQIFENDTQVPAKDLRARLYSHHEGNN